MVLALFASLAYSISVGLLYGKTHVQRSVIWAAVCTALAVHSIQVIIGLQGLLNNASLTSVLSLVAFCMAIGGAIRYQLKTDTAGYAVVALIAAVCVWFPVLLPLPETKIHSGGLKFHIVLSIAAYIAIGFAALYGCFLLLQDYRLRRGKPILHSTLPLNDIERTMLGFTLVGAVLLTLSLATGLLFIHDLWAQHVAHKVIFGAIAWVIIWLLLWRHFRYGFRGTKAARWLLIGFICLGLSYFGTAFVLQILL